MGRPPRIDRAAIAAATTAIPLEELTLRSVAEHLGVGVPSLYHYVSGKEDLLRLAAEQAALKLIMPVDHDQHWAVWFYEWAVYIRRAFAEDPELLKHYIDGAVGMDMMARHIDAMIGLCVRQGFTAVEAMHANELVAGCALGAAIAQIREDRASAEGRPFDLELRRILAHGDQDIPHLASLLNQSAPFEPAPFHEQITTVLAGIALRRGESLADIAPLLPRPTAAQP
jgi:AcrR family transcriptional regulator